jgi:hypothetical protein
MTGTGSTFAGTWDTTAAPEGGATVQVTATDPQGRTTTASRSVTVRIGPQVSLAWSITGGTIDLVATATSGLHPDSALTVVAQAGTLGPWSLAGDGTAYAARGIDLGRWPEGSTYVTVTATDPDGRATTAGSWVYVYLSPYVSWFSPGWGSTVAGSVPVAVTLSDPNDAPSTLTAELTVDGGTSVPMTFDAGTGRHTAVLDTLGLADGSHYLRVTARDPSGRTGANSQYVSVANLPYVTVEQPYWGGSVRGDVPVRVTASSQRVTADKLTVTMTGPSGEAVPLVRLPGTGTFTGTWASASSADGSAILTFTAVDTLGGSGTTTRSVYVQNAPIVDLFEPWSDPIGGVVPVRFRATRGDGAVAGLTPRWRVDSGAWRTAALDAYNGWSGYQVASLDTTALANGTHQLTLEVTDQETGRSTTVTRPIAVQQTGTFGVGLVSPSSGTEVTGRLTVQATVYGGKLAANKAAPVSAWYRVDGGAWVGMTSAGSGHFTAPWDTRYTWNGQHSFEVAATDWYQGVSQSTFWLTVTGATPFEQTIVSPYWYQTVDGIVPIRTSLAGGTLAGNPNAPVSAWYRIDDGAWVALTGPPSALTASWDTAAQLPGVHTVHLAATDYVGGSAAIDYQVTVADRVPLALSVVSPVTGSAGPSPVALVARAVGARRLPTGISVWARIGTGQWVALKVGSDGLFRGTVRPTTATIGTVVKVDLAAIDYLGAVAYATTSYTIR